MPNVTYRVLIDGEAIPFVSLSYEKTPLEAGQAPSFNVEVPNTHGYQARRYYVGRAVDIFRDASGGNGVLVFKGRIERAQLTEEDGHMNVVLSGPHYWYDKLMTKWCHHYRVDNGDFAPVINPWSFGRLVDTSQVLQDGLRPDEIVRQAIGTKLYWQEFFHNLDAFQSDPLATKNVMIRQKADGTGDGLLELRPTVTGYASEGIATSVVLQNGPAIVSPMGNATNVKALIIGTGGLTASNVNNETVTPSEGTTAVQLYSTQSIVSQTFTVAQRLVLTPATTNVRVYLRRVGTPTGFIYVRISEANGLGGVTQTINADTLATTWTQKNLILPDFTFEVGTTYYLSVEYGTTAQANRVEVCTGSAFGGGQAYVNYDTSIAEDLNFVVYMSQQHLPSGTSVQVDFSRDGGSTWSGYQSFSQISGESMKYETAAHTFAGAESVKNEFVYRLKLVGSGGVVAESLNNLHATTPSGGHAVYITTQPKVAQSFTVANNAYLNSGSNITLHLRKVGTPTGDFIVRVSSVRGDGGILVVGHVAQLTTTYAQYSFELPGNSLIAGTTYYVTVEYSDPSSSGSNYIQWGYGLTYANGQSSLYNGSTWSNDSNDMSFSFNLVRPSTNSPRVDYIKLDVTTESDTGLVEGEIDTYAAPLDADGDAMGTDTIAIITLGDNRAAAIESARKFTLSEDITNPSPYWDIKIREDGRVDFQAMIGQTILLPDSPTGKLGRGNGNTRIISRDVDGTIGNIIVGKGAGTEPYALTIQGDPYKDADSIELYGARVLTYIDSSITDLATLDNKVRAALRYYKTERETISIEGQDHFGVIDIGDFVYLEDDIVDTTNRFRVMELNITFDPETNSEKFSATLQNKPVKFANIVDSIAQEVENQQDVQQGHVVSATTSGNGTRMGKDQDSLIQAAECDIVITNAASVKRVFVNLKTEAFDNFATATVVESAPSTTTNAYGGQNVGSGPSSATHTNDSNPTTPHNHYMDHTHVVIFVEHQHGINAHSHASTMTFGIYKHRDGSGIIYPTKLALYVGQTNFDDVPKYPLNAFQEFGSETASISIQGVDISNATDRNGNFILREGSTGSAPGRFKEGIFKIFVLPLEDTTRNPKRLGKVVINAVVERQAVGAA